MNIKDEIEKVVTLDPDYGVLNICMAAYFPYGDPDVLTFGFHNWDHNRKEISDNSFNPNAQNTKYNNVLRNKGYITMCRKNGNKVCRAGFPVTAPLEAFKEQMELLIWAGTGRDGRVAIIRLNADGIDKKHPYACINMLLDAGSNNTRINGWKIESYSPADMGWNVRRYRIGNPFNIISHECNCPDEYRTVDIMSVPTQESFITPQGMTWDRAISLFSC